MHELGDLLQYPDDEELKNLIVLKPQWVAEHIGRVLVHPPVVESAGSLYGGRHGASLGRTWPKGCVSIFFV